ncbi:MULTISPECIES: hypothetical protein [unclassified Chelatococcus]|uniref:hypothetical protein n=1 Tax=unclassified Chelatococcus TaxID=2638111 RepID=UPI001BCF988D|nr:MULTISPECIES: hypothetical protein [unclassified Chelatococcus]MBS7737915.1 hypothetical protein [Chelatococcus sp. HY11]MCO5079369.1 hypothetical protein [Chelatococcus sp.]
MTFYHYTAAEYLRPIAKYGLTVGDVPTDLAKYKGRVGVWLTTSDQPNGHGLEGTRAVNKRRFRLTVEPPPNVPLVKWTEWAPGHVTPVTISNLRANNGRCEDTWHVVFGHIPASCIVAVHDLSTGCEVPDWGDYIPEHESLPGTPFWRREAWQRKTLGGVRRRDRALIEMGVRIEYA